jgi:hypothetical protein
MSYDPQPMAPTAPPQSPESVPNAGQAPAKRWTIGRIAGALGLFGLAASIWIHAIAAVAGVLFGTWFAGDGVAAGLGRGERDIALGPITSLSELAAGDAGAAPSLLDKPLDTSAAEASLAAVIGDVPDPTATTSSDSALGGGAGDPAGFMTGGDGAGDGGGSGLGGGGAGGSAKFFGIEARGKRFAYLCDVSGSMDEERISALKRELQDSINELSPGSSFSIILFSSDARLLTGDGWLDANPTNRAKVKTLLRAVQSNGGTEPLPGFSLLFSSLRPRPDAVYFMTDGEFARGNEDKVAAQITQLSRSGPRPVPVHCITFIEKSGEKIMQLIARSTGGKYRHVAGVPAVPGGVP